MINQTKNHDVSTFFLKVINFFTTFLEALQNVYTFIELDMDHVSESKKILMGGLATLLEGASYLFNQKFKAKLFQIFYGGLRVL